MRVLRHIITSITLSLITLQAFSQSDVPFDKKLFESQKDAFKAAEKEWKTGEDLFSEGRGQYKNALKHYMEAYKFNPDYSLLNYRIGMCYIMTIHKEKSVPYFEKAYKLNPQVSGDILLELGMSHHYNEDWDEAIKWYKKYEQYLMSGKTKKNANEINMQIAKFEKKIQECKYGKEFSAKPIRVFIDNIGGTINSPYPDFGVTMSADESILMITSRRPGSFGSKELSEKDLKKEHAEEDYNEDIFVSYKNAKGEWSQPVNMGKPINEDGHDATVSLSADGQSLIMYKSDGGGGLYETHLDGDKWSKPKILDKQINTSHHESDAAYSVDRKKLYFVSNKPEDNLGFADPAYGGAWTHDIFYCEWDEDKERWGEAKNVGPTLNTKYNEAGVFLHPDGKTMYFSSQGHTSMGGYDIFKSEYNEDTDTWSEPVNIGYPVNGADDDVFFVRSANGRKGYYASIHDDGYGEKDIYVITFLGPEKQVILASEDNLLANVANPISEKIIEPKVEVLHSAMTILKGKIMDALTKEPVEAEIELVDNTKNKVVAVFKSNSATGKYLVSLPAGRNYGIAVKHPDYLFHSENFDIAKTAEYQEVEKDVYLKKIAVGSKIVLKNIFFDFNKATLRPESTNELERLIQLLKDVPGLKIEIGGHTDSKGSDSYNQTLSEQRAQAVVTYLTDKGGISKSRLEFKGYGEKEPIATNETDEGRQLNRRTEFKITAN